MLPKCTQVIGPLKVANAVGCSLQRYRGHGFEPQPRRYFLDLFSRIDTVSGTEGLKMVCVALRNSLRSAMSAVLTGKAVFSYSRY